MSFRGQNRTTWDRTLLRKLRHLLSKLRHKGNRVISYFHIRRFSSLLSKVKRRAIHKIANRFVKYRYVWHKLFVINFIEKDTKVEIDYERSYELLNNVYNNGFHGVRADLPIEK